MTISEILRSNKYLLPKHEPLTLNKKKIANTNSVRSVIKEEKHPQTETSKTKPKAVKKMNNSVSYLFDLNVRQFCDNRFLLNCRFS